MSTKLCSTQNSYQNRCKASVPLTLAVALSLFGCSSVKTPSALKNLSLPNFSIPENDPSFRKRIYAGGSFGKSTLKPDTSGTVFNVSNSNSASSQFRLGIDLHNKLSVELTTSVLGKAQFAEGVGTDVSYTSASINALIYGLSSVQNRSRREGFSGYGKIGYGLVQHGSIVEPFDYSEKSVLLGLGAEYGFQNGLALRAEITRVDTDATVMGIGGIYRFGMAPESIGQVFVNAAKPALGAANSRTEVRNGKIVTIRDDNAQTNRRSTTQRTGSSAWMPKVSKYDRDGDGVRNAQDECKDTAPHTTVANNGCGMFDAVLSDVTFKPGSVWLSPKARGVLDTVSLTLLAFPEARVQVRAHTDNEGPADVNLGLSARRAESVVAYLTEKGVGELQLETLGLGESQPLDNNDTTAGRKRNRRVELMTLANIDADRFQDDALQNLQADAPSLGAAKASGDSNEGSLRAAAISATPFNAEPVFPPMSGVKIEPLPRSEYVPGLALGGNLQGVNFDADSATLTVESKPILQAVSEQMKQFPQVRLVVMAHTDNQQSPEESKALSAQRANSVVNFLVSTGIDAERLSAEGFGSSLPLAQNLTESDRARNRRIELRVLN